jgi:hypothetical protein
VSDIEVPNIVVIKQNITVLDPLEQVNESIVLEKNNSQESLSIDKNSGAVDEYRSRHTPEKHTKEQESRLSSEDNGKENMNKHHKNMKSDNMIKKKALQPSEFKMKSDFGDNLSPSRRMIENKKNRLKSNQSKHMLVNESQSQLSSIKNINKNESNKDLSKDRVLAASDRNDHTMSKKHVKNLREHIALKLYENNVPTNSHSKSSASNNSYIQKMLDAYNVFNYPQNSQVHSKYSHNMRNNLRNQKHRSKFREGDAGGVDRNRSLMDKKNTRNDGNSPGYPREKSVILPELSRSPNISIGSGRKKSIVSMKKKYHDKYIHSIKGSKARGNLVSKNVNKSTDLETMPSISKQLDRILKSNKISIDKTGNVNHK